MIKTWIEIRGENIALGEATHGNAEFQKLKLDVFKVMAENYGVRAFCLEGDYELYSDDLSCMALSGEML